MTRKVCINVPTATYSGKECSPLHFGLSAEGYDLNTVMEGYDKLMWIVRMKNNKKVWVRQNENTNKLVYEEPLITSVIENGSHEISSIQEHESNVNVVTTTTEKKEVKKITDYNMFLTYRLNELKKENHDNIKNKELFSIVIAEWKELKKKPAELAVIMEKVKTFVKNQ